VNRVPSSRNPQILTSDSTVAKLVIWRHWHRTFLGGIDSLYNDAWIEISEDSMKHFELTPSNMFSILIKYVDAAIYECITQAELVPKCRYHVLTENLCKPDVLQNF